MTGRTAHTGPDKRAGKTGAGVEKARTRIAWLVAFISRGEGGGRYEEVKSSEWLEEEYRGGWEGKKVGETGGLKDDQKWVKFDQI